MSETTPLTWVPKETFAFLAGLAGSNEKAWFDVHRADYDRDYIATGRALVESLGPSLREISPTLQFEPKVNGSLSRINRDIRFSRDKRPYKDHLDVFFWHGDRKGFEQPGFFLRISADAVWLGSGMHHFADDGLARFREAVVHDRSGKALEAAIAKVEASGDYAIGSMPRKTVPRGYEKAHPRAKYLLWEGLPAMARMTPEEAQAPDFIAVALGHFRNTWPIGRWLMDEVAG
jgi:uncharacterized protein (TIGR02453 family)